MERLKKADLQVIHDGNKDTYYVPKVLFHSPVYKPVRVEVKWAYVAILSVMLQEANYNEAEEAFVSATNTDIIETLKVLANKKVDAAKIAGYLNELEDLDLIEREDANVYLKKI